MQSPPQRGFYDFYFTQAQKQQGKGLEQSMILEEKLNSLFESWGYRQFKPSRFEEYDLYAENKDFLKSAQLITFTDLDGSLLALKPDITLSIIKNSSGAFDKLYYNENVYRPKDKHYQEIPQAGVECIGHISIYEEAEMLALAARALSLISTEYVLRISDLGLLDSMLFGEELSSALRKSILRDISEKNSSEINKKLSAGLIGEALASKLRALISIYSPMSSELPYESLEDAGDTELASLRTLRSLLQSFGIADRVYLDFSIINSMDYYNGIIFQGAVSHIPFTILSGGRYDRLPRKMGKDAGAIGFAVYMDIVGNYVLGERRHEPELLLSYSEDDSLLSLAEVSRRLRERGLSIRTVPRSSVDASGKLVRGARILSLEEAERL